jgi:hypothetical protein
VEKGESSSNNTVEQGVHSTTDDVALQIDNEKVLVSDDGVLKKVSWNENFSDKFVNGFNKQITI